MPLPDYTGGSLVNLMSSLLSVLSRSNNSYHNLSALQPEEIKDSRNIVLFVVDGLGYEYLLQKGVGSVLHQHLRSGVTSVFPSTTATAITTFMTGLAPQQHGLTAWHTWLKELGCITAVLPFRPRAASNNFDAGKIDVHQLYGHMPMFDLVQRTSYVVAPEWIIHSEYNVAHSGSAFLHGYDSLSQCFANITRIVRESDQEKYIYAYWPDFDRYSHESGNGSKKVATHFAELDEMFGSLIQELSGTETTLIVTADHGFIDTTEEHIIKLHEHPALQETLVMPLCGEPRAAYCYVHPDKQQQFLDYAQNELHNYVEVKPSQSLIDEHYFGFGPAHPQLLNRIGHYTLLLKENYVLKDWLVGEPQYTHIGVHGGTSQEEMMVPLIVAKL